MRCAVFKEDLNLKNFSHARGTRFNLDASTSVAQQKGHLLETLESIATIVPVEADISRAEYKALCSRQDTILVTVHHRLPWDTLPRRLLLHSLGDYMLTNVYFDHQHFSPNTINLMTSRLQAQRLKQHLGKAAPGLGVFTPRLKINDFYPPSPAQKTAARRKLGLPGKAKHIVYAGRWLATKGVCQVIRALNLWPMDNVRLTLAGNYEPGFALSQTHASHHTFAGFFARETAGRNSRVTLDMRRACGPAALRELLWSADVFVYPSIHEDENFGMAPREAVLCGVPIVVSDFCGLGQLGRGVGGLLATYPTLAGPRYSLKQLRDCIAGRCATGQRDVRDNFDFVTKECDPKAARDDLKRAAESLLRQPLIKDLPSPKYARRELLAHLLRYADSGIAQAIIEKNRSLPEGLLADGTGCYNKEFAYHRLLSVIQSFYTTVNTPVRIEPRAVARGFWRLALWPEERAVVEIGFPGPRMKHYAREDWEVLTACVRFLPGGEIEFCPVNARQCALVQELIAMGYCVPDSCAKGFK
jgi:glycosyltransferase involved in cell wall biosynthesis